MAMDFFTVFAAVLSAGLLIVWFVWGMVEYSHHERDGTENTRRANGAFVALILPLLFAAGAVYIVLS